jgi:hypothetical protein
VESDIVDGVKMRDVRAVAPVELSVAAGQRRVDRIAPAR